MDNDLNIENGHIKVVDTKTKILAIANALFARQGFDGVSIRDIANAADVNVASINYHFKNKLNLLHEIFDYNYYWLSQEVNAISERSGITLADLTIEIYRLFSSHDTAIINSFKMILSDHLWPEEDLKDPNKAPGPPGGEALHKILLNEVSESIDFERRDWAVRMIFSNIIHIATVMSTTYIKAKCCNEPWMNNNKIEQDIRDHANAIVAYLK